MKAVSVTLVTIRSARAGSLPSLGAASVAAALNASLGDKARISSMDVEADASVDAIAGRVLASQPDVVGFSLYCWNTLKALDTAQALRRLKPEIILAAGGPDAEWLVAQPDSPFDAIILGEGEAAAAEWLLRLIAGLAPGGPRPEVLRAGAVPARSLVSLWLSGSCAPARGQSVVWELARGCPYRCAYCYEGRGTAGLRPFPDSRLQAELDMFVRSGVSEVFVLDPTFNAREERALELLEWIAARGGGIRWNFEIRAELMTAELAKAFASVPCSLQIGLQSANPRALAAVNRAMDKKRFMAGIAMLEREGLVYGLDLIYGLPGDTLADFTSSLDFALGLRPNHLDVFPLAVLPGTELWDRADELGLEADRRPPYLLRSNPGFSASDMEKARLLASACDVFYSAGRAVPWFESLVKAMGIRASEFLGRFARSPWGQSAIKTAPTAGGGLPHARIEALQRAFAASALEVSGLAELVPLVQDLIAYHGALSRALAEGERSLVSLSHRPSALESPEIQNLASFARTRKARPVLVEILPGSDGPVIRIRDGAPKAQSQSRRRR